MTDWFRAPRPLFAFLAALAVSIDVSAKVFYEESFRNYRDTAPACATNLGITIGNDPVWTQSAEANCRMTDSGSLFTSFMPAAMPAPAPKAFDVLFRFRLQGESRFDLRLKPADGKPVVSIQFASNQVAFAGQAGASGPMPAPIPGNAWRQAAVTVRDGTLTVHVDDNRVLKPVLQAKVPGLALAGINFFGYKEKPFSVTRIVVREPAPLPDTSIRRLLPAPVPADPAAWKTAPETVVPAADRFGATVRTGPDKAAVRMTVRWTDGKTNTLVFGVAGIPQERKVMKEGKEVKEKTELPDAIIQVAGIGDARQSLQVHIRPKLRRYHTSYSFTDTYHDILRDWDLLPKASEHPLAVECRRTPAGLDLYLDGCFAGRLEGGEARDAVFALAPSASIAGTFSAKAAYAADRWLPLDIAALRMGKAFAGKQASLKAGFGEVRGIPMQVASGAGSADIGLVREGQGNWALEVDEYLARSPFDGLLTEVHFTVPAHPYTRAWVLCAVDPDPAKVPVLTTRLAHYIENGSGNNMLVDTVVTLPRGGEQPGPGVTPVGTVDGTLPLFLVEVPLRTGEIIDLAMGKPQLNFEFLGKTWENFEQIDNSSKPDPDSTSAVQVFGVTLEKSPVGLEPVQSQPANVFHNDEKPETAVVLKSFAPAKGSLAWTIRDAEGKPVGKAGSASYAFAAAGQEQRVSIPLAAPDLGWYELLVSVLDEQGKALLTHPERFALLGPDSRKAGYESPFGIWWFDGAHLTPKELEFAGPVMFKAGIRMVAWTGQKEKDMARWGLTKDQVNMPFSMRDLASAEELAKDPEAGRKKAEAAVLKADGVMKKHLEDYPHLREVLVFHESGPGNDVPVELVGVKPALTEALQKREQRYADVFNMAGRYFREKYPQLKLVVGNNSAAAACIAAVLRHGGNPDYLDSIGIEAPSQVYIPEKLQEWAIQGHHISRDLAKQLTGRDIPATGCYEFTYRCDRDMGEQQQAEWYARDVLISLANRFTRIGPGILFDCANAYGNGLWGGSGIMTRGPYGYPKKAYVAYATATRLLDRATFRRQIPTGSPTVYAIEFGRADGKRVVAVWASRGEAELVMNLGGDATAQVTGMYGDSRMLKTDAGRLTVKAGTAPAYVVADREIQAITPGTRLFPADEALARRAATAAPLDKVEDVSIDPDPFLETPLVAPLQTPIRKRGAFSLAQAKDEQKGDCLELSLKPLEGEQSKYITDYTTLRLKTPAALPGEPAAVGCWVKGNSSWGRIMFELVDAEGEVWRSVGTGGWGCDVLDWPGHLSLNFDGWSFVSVPLRASSLYVDHSPGPVLEQWVSGGGDKVIDYPVKVSALIVEMNRTALDLVDFKPVSRPIRIRDVGGVLEDGKP